MTSHHILWDQMPDSPLILGTKHLYTKPIHPVGPQDPDSFDLFFFLPKTHLICDLSVNTNRTKISLGFPCIPCRAQTPLIKRIWLILSLYMWTRWRGPEIFIVGYWGDPAACNNFLIIVNARAYCVCSNVYVVYG